MRSILATPLFLFGLSEAFACGDFMWPDISIAVPAPVHDFIAAECADRAELINEGSDTCVENERMAYRATVMMLSSPQIGEGAAERYRACRVGLGANGGRFHRRRAECIGCYFKINWRFETTRRASIPIHGGQLTNSK